MADVVLRKNNERLTVNSIFSHGCHPGGRGGGGIGSLKVGTHCQTTALAFWPCPPLGFL